MTRKNRNRKNKRRRKTRRLRGGASDKYITFDKETFKINEISGSMIDLQYQLDKVSEKGDGNCLFRSLAAGILKDKKRYEEIRKTACDFALKSIQGSSSPLTDEHNLYVCSSGEWGREPEIQAVANAHTVNIIVFQKTTDKQYDKYEYKGEGEGEGKTTIYLHLDGNHYDLLEKPGKMPDDVTPTVVTPTAKKDDDLKTTIQSVLEDRKKKGFRKITDVDQFYKTNIKLQGRKHPNKTNEQTVLFDVITKGPFFPTMIEQAMDNTRKADVALDAVFKQITGKTVDKPDPNKTMWFGYKT